MALKIFDRVQETTSSTGTGSPITLSGVAVSSFRTFGSVLTAPTDTTYYGILDGSNWEVGIGTYTATNTLARTTILASSNANAAISLSGNPANVWMDAPAKIIQSAAGLNTLIVNSATALTAAMHNGMTLIATSGASFSIDWNATGNGFTCSIVNLTGADLGLSAITNFTTNTAPSQPDGLTRIRYKGIGGFWTFTDGTNTYCQLVGNAAT